MSDLLHVRAVMTKKLNVMVRKIEGVTSFVLTGNDEYTPDEIYFVVGVADDSMKSKVNADLSFLIREFLRPIDTQKIESDGRMLSNYVFDNGLKAQIIIAGEKNLPPFEWWVPYMDKNGAALSFYPSSIRKQSDPTTDKPLPKDDFSDDFEDDFDDDSPAPVVPEKPQPAAAAEEPAAPVPAVTPVVAPAPARETEQDQSDKEKWKYFYDRLKVARHAALGGSVIYASEIIGELRTLLIKMMCEANGITEDYLHSVDLLPDHYRTDLLKTYPSKLEYSSMVAALAAEHAIFEKLMEELSL